MEKKHGLVAISKKSFFVFFNATAESVNCSFFLKNLEKHFCNRKFTATIIGKIYRLAVSPRAFSITDYRYRFSAERFIVPITGFNA